MNKHQDYHPATPPERQGGLGPEMPTIREKASNQQAPEKKELLFAALENYANLPPGLEALRQFRSEWQDFFPSKLYEASEIMESEQRPSPLAWYLRQLQAVWRGEDRRSARLCVLLGFDPSPNYEGASLRDPAFHPEFLAWTAIRDKLSTVAGSSSPYTIKTIAEAERRKEKLYTGLETRAYLGMADAEPDWKLGIIRCKFNCDFQEALYALMRESWRARICRNCERHFIADKSPQMYCSTKCFGEAKGKRSLEWWRAEGSDRRKKRRKGANKVKSSRRSK